MDTTKSGWRFWFSAYGRFNRRQYWLVLLSLLVLVLVDGFVGTLATRILPHQDWRDGVLGIPMLAVMWAGICSNTKRLHDLGRSGWWQVTIGALAGVFHAMAALTAVWGFVLFGLLLALMFTVVLGVLPGQAKANRFNRPETASAQP